MRDFELAPPQQAITQSFPESVVLSVQISLGGVRSALCCILCLEQLINVIKRRPPLSIPPIRSRVPNCPAQEEIRQQSVFFISPPRLRLQFRIKTRNIMSETVNSGAFTM
jgi:hypothetical protein